MRRESLGLRLTIVRWGGWVGGCIALKAGLVVSDYDLNEFC